MTENIVDSAQTDRSTLETFIRSVDIRYLKTYGNVASVSLLIWMAVMGVYLFAMGWSWLLLMVAVLTFLLTLMVMRGVVQHRGETLHREVAAFRQTHHLSLDEMLQVARDLRPTATFFISLEDGPLARSRRDKGVA